jgi:hypothetical protein
VSVGPSGPFAALEQGFTSTHGAVAYIDAWKDSDRSEYGKALGDGERMHSELGRDDLSL